MTLFTTGLMRVLMICRKAKIVRGVVSCCGTIFVVRVVDSVNGRKGVECVF